MPCSQRFTFVRHRESDQRGENHAAQDRDIGHGEPVARNERSIFQNFVEVAHAPDRLVAYAIPPFAVLVKLDLWTSTPRVIYNVMRWTVIFGNSLSPPTFKPDVVDLLTRSELRVLASFMNWSSDLDRYSTSDSLGKTDFNAGGVWQYGVRMETWF